MYRQTTALARDQWLASLTGIAARGDRVFVHDATAMQVHVLDGLLRPVSRFGRDGRGPGELAVPVALTIDLFGHYAANTLAVADTLLFVYDGRSIQAFDHSGRYLHRIQAPPQRGVGHGIRRLVVSGDELYFGYDSLDLRRGQRRLQTWRGAADISALVQAVSIAAPTVTNGAYAQWSRDPRPIWTLAGGCVVWGDGLNHRLVRVRLADGATDTIRLPQHRVPPDDYDPRVARRLAQGMGAQPPPPRPRNAPLWHWAGVVADPDGHVWVRPWTRSGRPEGPVYRIDPTGRIHPERIPAFPEAFGNPGVFYSRDRDPATHEILLLRYERQGTK